MAVQISGSNSLTFDPAAIPVFVDATGRRLRRLRAAGYGTGTACAAYLCLLVVAATAGQVNPFGLPHPGGAGPRVEGPVDGGSAPFGVGALGAAPVAPLDGAAGLDILDTSAVGSHLPAQVVQPAGTPQTASRAAPVGSGGSGGSSADRTAAGGARVGASADVDSGGAKAGVEVDSGGAKAGVEVDSGGAKASAEVDAGGASVKVTADASKPEVKASAEVGGAQVTASAAPVTSTVETVTGALPLPTGR
jgi:hypothetical protein